MKVSKPRLSVIDLFAGAGGLSLGAARAGFVVKMGAEKDARILAIHKTNFPKALHFSGDLKVASGDELLSAADMHANELDGIIGGPPCQGFSAMGNQNPSDPRSALFVRFFTIVQQLRPKFFLAENVPGILDKKFDSIREAALSCVGNYELLPPIRVNADAYGAPTTRTRIMFFGYLKDEMPAFEAADFFPSKTISRVRVSEALLGLPSKIKDTWNTDALGWRKIRKHEMGDFWRKATADVPTGVGHEHSLKMLREEKRVSGCIATQHKHWLAKRYDKLGPGESDPKTRCIRLDLNGFCPTLRAGTGSDMGSFQAVRPIHPTEARVITPREAARLQGFPDWFRFDSTKWHSFRAIGNSVSPIVSEALLSVVSKKMIAAAA